MAEQKQTRNQSNPQARKQTDATNVVEPIQEAVEASREQIETAFKASNESFATQYGHAMDAVRQQVEQTSDYAMKGASELTGLTKSSVDALVAATTNVTEGVESLSREVVTFTRNRFTSHLTATQKMFAVTSLRDLFDLQAQYARETIDNAMSESARLTEISIKMANDVAHPLQNQAQTTIDKVTALRPAA